MKKLFLLFYFLGLVIISFSQAEVRQLSDTVRISKRTGGDAVLDVKGFIQSNNLPTGTSTDSLVLWDPLTGRFKKTTRADVLFHFHAINQITGLQSALNFKLDKSDSTIANRVTNDRNFLNASLLLKLDKSDSTIANRVTNDRNFLNASLLLKLDKSDSTIANRVTNDRNFFNASLLLKLDKSDSTIANRVTSDRNFFNASLLLKLDKSDSTIANRVTSDRNFLNASLLLKLDKSDSTISSRVTSNRIYIDAISATKSPLAGSSSITQVGTLSSGSIPYSLITGTPTIPSISGNGFVKASGTTLSYDSSLYLNNTSWYNLIKWNGLKTFGNSITYGQGATVPDSNYVQRLRTYIGGNLIQDAVSGNKVYDQNIKLMSSDTIPWNRNYPVTWEVGINDVRYNGNTNYIAQGVKNFLVQAFSGGQFIPASSMTQTGSWTTGSLLTYNSSAKTNGLKSTTKGDILSFSFVGNNVFIAFDHNTSGGYYPMGIPADIEVSIDGNVIDTSGGYGYEPIGTWDMDIINFYKLNQGTHTVSLRNIDNHGSPSGRSAMVDYAGVLKTPDKCYPAIVGDILHTKVAQQGSSGTWSVINNTNDLQSAVVDKFKSLGFPVDYIRTNNYFDTTNTVDGLHPNDAGYRQIYNAFISSKYLNKSSNGVTLDNVVINNGLTLGLDNYVTDPMANAGPLTKPTKAYVDANIITYTFNRGLNSSSGAVTLDTSKSYQWNNDQYISGITVGAGKSQLAQNTALGRSALGSVTTGNFNTGIGTSALQNITTGTTNTGIGSNTFGYTGNPGPLFNMTTGVSNVAVGNAAMYQNISGSQNVSIGTFSGNNSNTAGSNSVFIGYQARPSSGGSDINEIAIGNLALGLGSNTTVIGNSSTVFSSLFGRLGIGSQTDDGSTTFQLTGSMKTSGATTHSALGTGVVHSSSVGLLSSSLVNLTSATDVTGILPVANGGTGSNTQNFVDLTNTQSSIVGAKTFTGLFAASNRSLLGGAADDGSTTLQVTGKARISGNLNLNGATDNAAFSLNNLGVTNTGGLSLTGITFTTSQSVSANSFLYVFNGASGQTLTLPNTSGNNGMYTIKNNTSNTLTVAAYSGTFIQTSSGSVASITLAANATTMLISNGGSLFIQIL